MLLSDRFTAAGKIRKEMSVCCFSTWTDLVNETVMLNRNIHRQTDGHGPCGPRVVKRSYYCIIVGSLLYNIKCVEETVVVVWSCISKTAPNCFLGFSDREWVQWCRTQLLSVLPPSLLCSSSLYRSPVKHSGPDWEGERERQRERERGCAYDAVPVHHGVRIQTDQRVSVAAQTLLSPHHPTLSSLTATEAGR